MGKSGDGEMGRIKPQELSLSDALPISRSNDFPPLAYPLFLSAVAIALIER
jgi:hypothetical protein